MSAGISNIKASAAPADVCLLLEGTYPYVRGGVSTWVHQVITALPELSFAIAYIGSEKASVGGLRYDLPANIVSLSHNFLFDDDAGTGRPTQGDARCNARLREAAAEYFLQPDGQHEARHLLLSLSAAARQSPAGFDAFWEHPDSWELVREYYQRHLADESFIDVYWSLRFMLRPLWRLAAALVDLPEATVYHSVSTGYAGLLGVMASQAHDAAFLLSEHGIYVRERITEMLRADWSPSIAARPAADSLHLSPVPASAVSPLRQLWIEKFVEIGRYSYEASDHIVSLFQKNAEHQVEFGAPRERISIIPNGVNISQFDTLRVQRQAARRLQPDRMQVGFLGRIVEIKDIKTLLRAAAIVAEKLPAARFLIMGPFDEDSPYADECEQLTRQLEIVDTVDFTGSKTLAEALPATDLMVLSSVSEGLPFVALEAFATGIPLVATDVGSCRELVEGRADEIPTLGPAGKVVAPGEPAALAAAIVSILADRQLQEQFGAAGRNRVELVYSEHDVVAAYRDLYASLPELRQQRLSVGAKTTGLAI